jgi:hypothetical protein
LIIQGRRFQSFRGFKVSKLRARTTTENTGKILVG